MAGPRQRIPVETARFYFTPAKDPFEEHPLAGRVAVLPTSQISGHTHDIKAACWADNWSSDFLARKHIARLLAYLEEEHNVTGSTVKDILDELELPRFPGADS